MVEGRLESVSPLHVGRQVEARRGHVEATLKKLLDAFSDRVQLVLNRLFQRGCVVAVVNERDEFDLLQLIDTRRVLLFVR